MKGTGKFTFYYLIVKSFKELNMIAVLSSLPDKNRSVNLFFVFELQIKKKCFTSQESMEIKKTVQLKTFQLSEAVRFDSALLNLPIIFHVSGN